MSIDTLGPRRSSRYETRPVAMPCELPVLACAAIGTPGATGTLLFAAAFGYLIAVTAFTTSLDYAYRTVVYRDTVGLPTEISGLTRADLAQTFSRA